MEGETPLSNCPGKCGASKAGKFHPNLLKDLDMLIAEGIPITAVSEAMTSKFKRCCDVHPEGFDINYNVIYRHKAHLVVPIQTKQEQLEFTKKDPQQSKIMSPEFVQVTTIIRRKDVDKFRKIDVKANLNERLQSIENEMTIIDERLAQIPATDTEKYMSLHGLKLKYTAEYRLINGLISSLPNVEAEGQKLDETALKNWIARLIKKKDEDKGQDTNVSP